MELKSPQNTKKNWMTCRRWYLDFYLETIDWSGDVLDIGGKKTNKRGYFSPPYDKCKSWKYLNNDNTVSPDYLASADAMPLADRSFDMVLMTEVIEHLREPEKAISEAYRVLRKNGLFIASAPFLYPIHADPDDFQRWLPSKYNQILKEVGFSSISILPMGGFCAVVHDLIKTIENNIFITFPIVQKCIKILLIITRYVLFKIEKLITVNKYTKITTGYFIIAKKIG